MENEECIIKVENRFLQNCRNARKRSAELHDSGENACCSDSCTSLELLESELSADEGILLFGMKKRQVVALEKIASVLQSFLDLVNEGMINKITIDPVKK